MTTPTPTTEGAPTTGAPLARTFDTIVPAMPSWLWGDGETGLVPDACVTVLFGDPGTSKSLWTIDLAARVSRGDSMPDGSPGVPAGTVLLAALEDDAACSVAWRLRAARANLGNVVDASGGPTGDGFELTTAHVAWLRTLAADHPNTRLIVIDTMTQASPRATTSGVAIKAMLSPLTKLARSLGVAIILVAHTTKAGQLAGAQAVKSIPRMILRLDKADDGSCCVRVDKSNLVPVDGSEAVRYKVLGKGTTARIEYAWDADRRTSGPQASAQRRIEMVVRNASAPVSLQEIVRKTGVNYAVATVLTGRMVKAGTLVRESRGHYSAPVSEAASA